jgi:Bacterial type II secretion system protein N.
MKRILSYSLLGLAAFLLFLLLLAPATLVSDWVGARLSGFSAQAVEGTATAGPCGTCAGAVPGSNACTGVGARWRC